MRKHLNDFVIQFQKFTDNQDSYSLITLMNFFEEYNTKICKDTIEFKIVEKITMQANNYTGLEKNVITLQLEIVDSTTPLTGVISDFSLNSSGQLEFKLSESIDLFGKLSISTLLYNPRKCHKWYSKTINSRALLEATTGEHKKNHKIEII